MGPVKEHGEIPTSYTVSETLSSSASLVVEPTEVSTGGQDLLTSTDDPTVSSTTGTANRSATATKLIASDYFLWMVNHFFETVYT